MTVHPQVIYLPARPTEEFKSFSAPILNFEDTHITSSFFGPWAWTGLVKPVSGGGIPADLPRLEFKMAFKDGGYEAFLQKFGMIQERLHHARDIRAETGQIISVDEPLPQYEAARGSSGAGPSGSGRESAPPSPERSASRSQQNQPGPADPPPDYEEAQSQAVGMRLEESLREEADRG